MFLPEPKESEMSAELLLAPGILLLRYFFITLRSYKPRHYMTIRQRFLWTVHNGLYAHSIASYMDSP